MNNFVQAYLHQLPSIVSSRSSSELDFECVADRFPRSDFVVVDDGLSISAWRRFSVLILIVAFIARAAWGLAVPVVSISDPKAYEILSKNIVAGHGFTFKPGTLSAYWPVGTSAIYAAFFQCFGDVYWPIVAFHVIVGVVSVWLTMDLTRIWFGPRAGLAAGTLMAIWPGQVEYTTILASELLFNFFVLLGLYFWYQTRLSAGMNVMLVGSSLAVASYVRPLALPLLALFLWFRLVHPERLGRSRRSEFVSLMAQVLATGLVMGLLIMPWTLRNARVFGQTVLISTNGGANFWMGNNPATSGGYMKLPEETRFMNEVERNKHLGDLAKSYIRENPRAFAILVVKKLIMTHDRESIGVVWNETGLVNKFGRSVLMPLKVISTLYFWGALLLACVGIIVSFQQLGLWRCIGLPPLILWLYFAAIHAITVGGDRYHYPSVPWIASLAGLGFISLIISWFGQEPGKPA